MRVLSSILKNLLRPLIIFIISLLPTMSVAAQSLSPEDVNSIYNDTVWYESNVSTAGACGTGTINLSGSDNIQKALNFLVGSGLSVNQAAGVIGNLEQESGQGLNPLAQQNGSTSPVPIAGVGFGIAQWTDASRQQNLVKYAQQNGGQPGDLAIQLGFLWQELTTSYQTTLQHLKATTTVDDAVNQFVGPNNLQGQPVSPTAEVQRTGGYENPGTPHMQNRLDYARTVADTYGGSSGSSSLGCGSVSANCTSASQATPANSNLSQTRQNIVCIAQGELALWKSQPGYPNPAYSLNGYYKYSQNIPEEWCADFVSWVYDNASYPLQPDPNWRVSYVPNIQSIGQQNMKFHWHPLGSNYVPKPGDLAIHGASHVNIYISSQGATSQYIGGDQGSGPYPGGSIVSIETGSGYYDNGITGYVSPD